MVLSVARGWLDEWRIVSLPGGISAFLWEDRSGPGHMTSAGLFGQEDCHWLAVIAGGRHFDCQVPGDLRFLCFPPLLRGTRLLSVLVLALLPVVRRFLPLLLAVFLVLRRRADLLRTADGMGKLCRFLLARQFVHGFMEFLARCWELK